MSEEIKDKERQVDMASEPAVAYAPTMFDKVISYLHSSHMPIETKRAVYLQLQAEVADENLGYMKRRLKELPVSDLVGTERMLNLCCLRLQHLWNSCFVLATVWNWRTGLCSQT